MDISDEMLCGYRIVLFETEIDIWEVTWCFTFDKPYLDGSHRLNVMTYAATQLGDNFNTVAFDPARVYPRTYYSRHNEPYPSLQRAHDDGVMFTMRWFKNCVRNG